MDINYDTITSTINQNTNWYFRRKSVFEESIKVEYYGNDHKLKEVMQNFFIKNQKSSLKIHRFKLIFKLFACFFYVLRICYDGDQFTDEEICTNIYPDDSTSNNSTSFKDELNWCAIFWVNRITPIWLLQSLIAVCCLIVATIHPYLQYNGIIRRIIFNRIFIIEILCNFPFVITLVKPSLNTLFIPSFLNCWLAKQTLEDIYCERARVRQTQSALSHRLMTLSATLGCLIFTSVCGFQHLQRAGKERVNLIESLYFVIVTFSTVGYGDYKPDNMLSRVFVVIMILVSIIVLPSQFDQLINTYKERKKMGLNFHLNLSKNDKHVVVCSTTLESDMILDFLNEFYAHPLLEDFYTILLSPCELDFTMKTILQSSIWAQRVIYIRGSVLKDVDLRRASIHEAEACFILAVRNCDNYDNADEHNILRSFAVRDFAPDVPQYVQIFRAKNKMHVAFAEQVVCEDEMKYALLANNCLNPGTSTLITLLIHTSRGEEGKTSEEEWHKQYGKSSGNEIYHVQLKDSRFFGEYDGKSFTYAAFNSHKKYGVTLIGIQTNIKGLLQIILNPGPAYILKQIDICFYINVNEEKNAAFFTTMIPADPMIQRSPSSAQSPVERYANKNFKRQSRFSISGLQKANRFIPKSNLFTRSSSETSETNNSSVFIINEELNNNNIYKNNGITNPAMEMCSKSGKPQSECFQCTCHANASHGIASQTHHALESQNSVQYSIHSGQTAFENKRFLDIPSSFARRNRHLSIERVPEVLNEHNLKEIKFENKDPRVGNANIYLQGEHIGVVKDYPPEIPYVGVSPIRCYITKEKRAECCLILDKRCKHTNNTQAEHYEWLNKSIILGAQCSSNGIYNFILRLRAHIEESNRLRPIILLLEKKPNVCFLDAISWFPLVYWCKGSIDNLDNLLIAGIHKSDSVVVVNNESTNSLFSIHLADCNTIIAIQSINKMFPGVRIMSELSQSSNMRFMQFRAHDIYALSCSKREKLEQECGSHIAYIFRLPFAAGSVFSASMLDTLLYQSFVKEYIIGIVRHLLGIDQTNNSGYLSCKKITKDDLWIRTYQRLFQRLATTTYEIPIGIYRTQKCPDKQLSPSTNPIIDRDYVSQSQQVSVEIEKQEIANLVRNRMKNFGIPQEVEDRNANSSEQLSYVIVNPERDLLLQEGDIIYIIKQANIEF